MEISGRINLSVPGWYILDRPFRLPVDHDNRAYAGTLAVRAWYAADARCTCGCREDHEIAHRYTVDGYRFEVTAHGGVIGTNLRGGIGDRPRAAYRRAVLDVIRDAAWMTFDEACAAIRAARKRHLDEMAAAEREVYRAAYDAWRPTE